MNIGNNIDIAASLIKQGKLVAFPTETVYGLGADALNPMAVARIFELKERPVFDPLIIHIADKNDIKKLTSGADERIFPLIEKFWPGPLTLVLPKSEIVPDIVTSDLPTVGIRMPDNPLALELIHRSGSPVAAPSANKFGRISPTKAEHVGKYLPGVNYILDGGETKVGIESTIITVTTKGFQILRNGVITREELEEFLPFDESAPTENIVAPGMLKSHYSPLKRMMIAEAGKEIEVDPGKAGLISFSGNIERGFKEVIRLSQTGDLREYAVKMFAAMHSLEESDVEIIVAEAVPEKGIGIAIMDRLRKAAYRDKK